MFVNSKNKTLGLCLMLTPICAILASNGFVSDAKAQSCVTPPPGLVSWWDGDSVSGDIVFDIQNGNDGILMEGATIAPGKVGQAFRFDGVDDYVEVSNSPNLNPGISDFSMDAWIKTSVLSNSAGSTVQTIAGFRGGTDMSFCGGGNNGYIVYLCEGIVRVRMGDDSSGCELGVVTGINVADGTFHHVAVAVDRDSPIGGKIYIDGMLVTIFDPTARSGNIANPSPNRIGSDSVVPNQVFQGLIDEVSIYNRALTASEIEAIFLAGSAGKCKLTVEEMIMSLAQEVMDLNLQQGITNSLDAKLDAVLNALDDVNENNDVAAINSLNAFINAVEAQRGKHIPEEDADALITVALDIIAVLNP